MTLYPIDWLLFAGLVAVMATWIVLDRLAARWQRQGERWLDEVDAHLQAVRAAVAKGEQGAQEYLPGDRRPYGALAADLHHALARARDRQPGLAQQTGTLRGRCFAESQSILLTLWYGFWARPRYYRSCWRDVEKLRQAAGELRKLAGAVEEQLVELEEMPLAAARRARDLHGLIQQSAASVRALVAAQAQGRSLTAMGDGLRELASGFDALPPYWLHGSDSDVMQQAGKASVCDAWEVLDGVEDSARACAKEVGTWLTLLRQIKQDLATVQQAIRAADLALTQTPAAVNAADLAGTLASLRSQAIEAETWLRYPNVDSLRRTAGDIGQVAGQARQVAEEAGTLLATYQLFRETLLRGAATLRRAGDEMNRLARRRSYRIEWQASRAEFDRLRTLEEEIGQLETTRPATRLRKDLGLAQSLDKRANALESHVADVRKLHARLVPLLGNSALPGQSWLTRAGQLSGDSEPYAWNEDDVRDAEVRDVHSRAASLAGRHALVVRYVNKPLPESILTQDFIDQVQALIRDLRDFEGGLGRVEGRIREVTAKDQAARQALDARRPGLARFLQDWQPPETDGQDDEPLAAARQPLTGLPDQARQHAARLGEREPAQILETAGHVSAWAKTCDDTARQLLGELRGQMESQAGLLEGDMRALLGLAPFAREPALEDARDALQARRQAARAWEAWDSRMRGDWTGRLDSQAGQLSTALTGLNRARRRLRETAGDLIPRYQEIEACRAEAEASLEQLRALGANQSPEGRDALSQVQFLIKRNDGTLKKQRDWGERFDKVRAEFEDIAEAYRQASRVAAEARAKLEGQLSKS